MARGARLLAVSLLLVAPPARAQQSDIEAEHLRGLQLREVGRDREALEVFRALYERTREPRALARMALAEARLELWDRAEEHMLLAIQARRNRWIRQNRRGLAENLAVIRTHVGSVEIRCSTPGATLFVRGETRGALPLPGPVRLPLGSTEIEVRAPGFLPARQTVSVVSGPPAQVLIALASEPPAPVVVATPTPPVQAPVAPPPVVCPDGQFVTPDTAGHCCWPGQVFAASRNSCVGIPRCVAGLIAEGERCVPAPRAPEAPAVAPPPQVIVQVRDPESPLPPPVGRFEFSLFGGFGFNSDVHRGLGGLRLGYAIAGRIYLGAYGFYSPNQAANLNDFSITDSGFTLSRRAVVRWSVTAGLELGVEITPGRWIFRPSVIAGMGLARREDSFVLPDANGFSSGWTNPIFCEEEFATLLPGLTILAPVSSVFYLGFEARYAYSFTDERACIQNDTRIGLLGHPGPQTRNDGVIINGQIAFRF